MAITRLTSVLTGIMTNIIITRSNVLITDAARLIMEEEAAILITNNPRITRTVMDMAPDEEEVEMDTDVICCS